MAIKKYIGPNRLSEIFSYIKAELDKKVNAVSGKGLSTNDYTTTEKNKLAGISSGAEVNVQADWDVDNTSSDAYILNKPTSMPASDVPSWAKQPNKPSYTFSEIASKPTTIAGYGITDAKIANGTITLGSNSITPLTQHQDISGKADKATTLAGYGITDAKIANGTITLGSNTITPLTSHQTVSNKGATLAWSTAVTVATIGSTDIKVSLPANPNTNTTYTFADGTNGFTVTPSGGSAQTVKVTPSITNNVTGSGTSGYLAKFNGANTITNGPQLGSSTTTYLRNDGSWATPPDNNTTYTIATGDSNGQIKVTPSSGSAYNVSVKGLGSSAYTTEDSISPYEANLRWGGKNFVSSYGPIDAALMDELGANRLQFTKASAITVEYSRDAGSTWTDYGASDAQKMQIFAQGGSLVIGKADSTNKATANPGKYLLRITIDTGTASIYTVLNKVVVYCSTNGSANCYCKIQKALQSTPTTFVDHTDNISISGWSGYNVINISGLTTYGNTASSQYGRVRFIFGDGTGGNTSYNGLNIFQIKGFGGVGWSTPSTMAKTGHLYSYNESQNATFPAAVTATQFNGSLAWSNVSSKPTTIAGYGITDAKIANGVITLGSNTITPLTSITSSQVTTALGYTPYNSTNPSGYITSSGSCASATKATQDGSGNVITTTYMKKGVDYVTAGLQSGVTIGHYATAEGTHTSPTGDWGHAEGVYTVASGYASHAEGGYSDNENVGTTASGNNSHAEGLCTKASGLAAHAEGSYYEWTYSGVTYEYTNTASGIGAHAEGCGTTASGKGAHAEGCATEYESVIVNTASGTGSHAEGCGTTASGFATHVEGSFTLASQSQAHAEGYFTQAKAVAAHAEGWYTIASSDFQHVEGKYNVADSSNTYAHIIGGGTSTSNRKNIFTVDWSGNVRTPSSVYAVNFRLDTSSNQDFSVYTRFVPANFSSTNYTLQVPNENGTLATREHLKSSRFCKINVGSISKTTDQYGQFSLAISNSYVFACWVDYRYWVMRHGENSFRLMKQGSYAVQASTTVTVVYLYGTLYS